MSTKQRAGHKKLRQIRTHNRIVSEAFERAKANGTLEVFGAGNKVGFKFPLPKMRVEGAVVQKITVV